MQAVKLNEQITIKRKNVTRDNMGGEIPGWVDDAPIWANAEPIRGREYIALQQAESELEVRFTVNYLEGKDVTPDCRIDWRGTIYELVSPPIDVKARRRWIELYCRTAQSA